MVFKLNNVAPPLKNSPYYINDHFRPIDRKSSIILSNVPLDQIFQTSFLYHKAFYINEN